MQLALYECEIIAQAEERNFKQTYLVPSPERQLAVPKNTSLCIDIYKSCQWCQA
jgi:hypothetical protein